LPLLPVPLLLPPSSLMHYHLPLPGVLFLHSGCNMGPAGDVTLFLGLSGE
jgi:phosphoenolpyruvate carboxykinase (ATP)